MLNRKKLIFRYIFWGVALAVATFIFINSAKVATDSTQISKGFTNQLFKIFWPNFSALDLENQAYIISASQLFVRKSAHFLVFFALGFSVAAALKTYPLTNLKVLIFAQIISTSYAISDELHQLFVQGRAGRVYDVLLDSAGALCGIIFIIFTVLWFKHLKGK